MGKSALISQGVQQVAANSSREMCGMSVGKRKEGLELSGAFRKTLFGNTFRFVYTFLSFSHDEARRGLCRR